MSDIVLLYDRDCPNARAARENLLRAFVEAGASPRWVEVDRAAEDTPARWRGYGSPTILIDGADALGAEASGAGASCRLYRDGEAVVGVPSVSALASAIATAETRTAPPSGTAWGRLLTAAPGVGAALLPKVACPACWPAYAGLLSALGLGFLMETRYLLPLTIGFLALALGAIGWRARSRRGFGPPRQRRPHAPQLGPGAGGVVGPRRVAHEVAHAVVEQR